MPIIGKNTDELIFRGKGGKLLTALRVVEDADRLYTTVRPWFNRFTYTVSIDENDALFADVHDWLTEILPEEKHRSLAVLSPKSYNGVPLDSDSESEGFTPKPLRVLYNSKAARHIVVDGHKVSVAVFTPEPVAEMARSIQHASINFTMRTHAAQQAVVNKLRELNAARATERKAVLKMVGQWGDWRTRSDLPPRTMDSVSLPPEQKERIVSDLRDFLGAEDQYNRLAIPWHRGYMFHGPPGTGKTSLVKALANEFNLDLWYISPSDLKAESSLLGLLASVGPRSLLLLEDIDTIKITHDRDSSEQGTISMGSLLNTLDGVATPHGLVTVMTTNRFELLDPALTRAGRMDMVERLDYPSLATVSNMYQHFYGFEPEWDGLTDEVVMSKELSTSQVAEIMKRNLDNPEKAEREIIEMYLEE